MTIYEGFMKTLIKPVAWTSPITLALFAVGVFGFAGTALGAGQSLEYMKAVKQELSGKGSIQ